jgi:hypothetical protein
MTGTKNSSGLEAKSRQERKSNLVAVENCIFLADQDQIIVQNPKKQKPEVVFVPQLSI